MTRLTPERWQQMEALFEQALGWPPEEREQQLLQTCGGDTELHRQVLGLLGRHEQLEGFLETPVSRLLETAAIPVGQAIGPYRVIDRLGEGGMGVVYLAERADGQFSKRVALKLLPASATSEFLVERFLAERQLLAQLEHPNIARLLDGGTAADGSPYLVMEYVDGESIDAYCNQRRLGVRERLALFLQVCAAVSYAHRQRVIHRDLKPGNILVSDEGMVKLLDFGIARLLEPEAEMTATANRMFTPAYAAPEQLQGAALSPATDVYALGAVLYELLTLRRPLPVPTQDGEAKRTVDPPSRVVSGSTIPSLEGLPEPPSQLSRQLRGELDAVVMKALTPSPDQRYLTVDALVHDIRNHLGSQPVEAFGRSWLYRARKFLGRHSAAAVLTATSLALVISLGWFLYGRQGPSTARTVAVLPFTGMGTPIQENYLVDGLTIDLTTQLGKVADLTVLADKAAMRYKDSPKSLKEIARELGATHVLTGSVRWSSDRIRVAARLVEPESGRQLWAEGYDRQLKDVFAIQSEVARSIAGALEAQLPPREQAHLEQIPTANVTAYQYYLQGREYSRRRSRKDNDQALKLYKEALALDPDFALAHAGVAAVYFAKATSGDGPAWVQAGCAKAHQAVALAPSLAESYNVLGNCHVSRGEQLAAQDAYRRSIELNPNYHAPVYNFGNVLLLSRGKLDEALPWMRRTLALDPTDPLVYERLYFVYMLLGEQAQAERYLQRGLSLAPDYERFGWIQCANLMVQQQYSRARQVIQRFLQDKPNNLEGLALAGDIERVQGRWPQARPYYEKIRSLVTDPDWYGPHFLRLTTVRAHVESKENRPERVKALLASSLTSDRQGIKTGRQIWISWYDMAAIHAIRGEQDLALVALKQAIDSGFYFVKKLEGEPIFVPLHNNKAFKRLLSDLKDRVEAMRLRARAQQT